MGLIQDTDKFVQYRYKIDEFKVLNAGDVNIETFQIIDMYIENNYETDIFPIFKVSLNLDAETYYAIIKNKNTVKFKIRIQKYVKDVLTDKTSLFTNVINDTFSVFLDDNNDQFDEELFKTRRETDGIKKGEKALFELGNVIDLYMFKDVYVSNIRNDINKIISSANLTTAIAWLLSKGGLNGALMSPMDNRNVYSPLIIPPMHIIDAIRHLDAQYGFYKTGAMIFFGLDKPYILNYKGGCTAWVANEWKETVIMILERHNEHSRLSSSIIRKDEKRFYINIQDDLITILNNANVNNAIQGVSAKIIDANGDNINVKTSSATVKGQAHSKIFINDTSNSYLGTTYAFQQSANNTVITISSGDFNIEAIAPNKQFSFIFEKSKLTQQYKGNYMISSSAIRFNKDGADFSMSASCTFKKM